MQLGETGDGYPYLRSRARGEDVTVYLHWLGALEAGHSLEEIVADDTEVHHVHPILEWWTEENVEVVDAEEHVDQHDTLPRGRQPLVATDGGQR